MGVMGGERERGGRNQARGSRDDKRRGSKGQSTTEKWAQPLNLERHRAMAQMREGPLQPGAADGGWSLSHVMIEEQIVPNMPDVSPHPVCHPALVLREVLGVSQS